MRRDNSVTSTISYFKKGLATNPDHDLVMLPRPAKATCSFLAPSFSFSSELVTLQVQTAVSGPSGPGGGQGVWCSDRARATAHGACVSAVKAALSVNQGASVSERSDAVSGRSAAVSRQNGRVRSLHRHCQFEDIRYLL